jgi:GT2 family glycosyltransferase
MDIGIGVCSYQRPELATDTCRDILNTVDSSKHHITTVCSLDDENVLGYEWVSKNFNLIYGKNKGVAANKNRILKYLEGNDFIFIAEDDIKFNKPGWVDVFIKAEELTKFQHFNYIVSNYREFIKRTVSYGDISVGDSGPYVNGVLMVMSKKCLEIVGGFDERYGRYGYEHVDYTNRCKKAGIHPSFNFHVMEVSSYIDWTHSKSCLSDKEKEICIKQNEKIFHEQNKVIYNDSYKKAQYQCWT